MTFDWRNRRLDATFLDGAYKVGNIMAGKKLRKHNSSGQALIEFALIILIVAFLIFIIIEGARILQADLTAQNAARAAGRYAITGQYDASCLAASPPCDDPRVESIKNVARAELAGLPLVEGAQYEDPNYYLIEVVGADEDGNQIPDYAGVPGGPVMVRVTYRVGMVTPLTRPIAETVRVIGQVVMNNERFTQVSNTTGGDEAPVLTPFPTPGASPTTSPPDLEVSKSASVDPAVVGVPFLYTINVVNLADTDASNVQMVDQLPANFTYVSSPTHDADCSATGSPPTVTCDLGDIPGNGGVSVELEVTAGAAGTDIDNTARVDYPGDPDTSNNANTATIDVIAPPSDTTLDISKGASASVIAVSDELVYSISVVNTGVAAAQSVQITDDVPASMSVNSATSSQGSCSVSGNTVTCDLGDIPRDGTATATIRVTTSQQGVFSNTAEADADNADPDQDSVDVEVRNIADLGVTKSASANPGVGEDMTYTVSVVNNGPANATGVSVTDALPPSVNFVSAAPSQGTCSETGNVVSCNLGAINDGAGATINIHVIPTALGTVTNNVSVQGNEDDPYGPNDSFPLDTVIQPRADLSIAKFGPSHAVAGTTVRYDITVENLGPSTARGVYVVDTLPANVTFVAAAASGATEGTCSGSNSSVTCNLGVLPAGNTATIEIWIIPRRGPEIVNVATVGSSTIDPDLSNNTTTQVETEIDDDRPYIILDPVCGPAGETIDIYGYSWQDGGNYREIELYIDSDGALDLNGATELPESPVARAAAWIQQITIPAGTADGDYFIKAYQTRQGNQEGPMAIAELTVPCPAPNLIISTPQLISGTPLRAGEPTVFTADVTNIGNLDAVSQFFAGLYADPSPAPTNNSTHIDQQFRHAIVALNGLAAGASKTVTFTVEAGFSTGTHQVYGVADSDPGPNGVIPVEHDETDNISSPVQVTVGDAPTATPTATATPGVTPTPTATPTAGPTLAPGSLLVTVNNDLDQPQANAEITVIDEATSEVVATDYSDINGTHYFDPLPPATYTVTACVVVENLDYYAYATGITVQSGAIAQLILYLQYAPGGCT